MPQLSLNRIFAALSVASGLVGTAVHAETMNSGSSALSAFPGPATPISQTYGIKIPPMSVAAYEHAVRKIGLSQNAVIMLPVRAQTVEFASSETTPLENAAPRIHHAPNVASPHLLQPAIRAATVPKPVLSTSHAQKTPAPVMPPTVTPKQAAVVTVVPILAPAVATHTAPPKLISRPAVIHSPRPVQPQTRLESKDRMWSILGSLAFVGIVAGLFALYTGYKQRKAERIRQQERKAQEQLARMEKFMQPTKTEPAVEPVAMAAEKPIELKLNTEALREAWSEARKAFRRQKFSSDADTAAPLLEMQKYIEAAIVEDPVYAFKAARYMLNHGAEDPQMLLTLIKDNFYNIGSTGSKIRLQAANFAFRKAGKGNLREIFRIMRADAKIFLLEPAAPKQNYRQESAMLAIGLGAAV